MGSFVGVLLLGGGAALCSFAIASRFAGSLARTGALLLLGVLLITAWLLAVYIAAPSAEAPTGCSDCGEYFGKWVDPTLLFVVAGGNAIGWTSGTIVGSAARAALRRRARLPRNPESMSSTGADRRSVGRNRR